MALSKQPFYLPFAQGMDQKKDPKVLTGGLETIENSVFRKDGEVEKRLGWTSFPTAIVGGGSIDSADAITTYGKELLLWSKNRIYTWSISQQGWYDRGVAYSAAVSTKQIISAVTSYDFADSIYAAGAVLVAYEITNTVRYQLYDYASGAILKGDTELSPGSVKLRPKCVTIDDMLYIFYSTSSPAGYLYGAIIDPSTGAVSSIVTIATDLNLTACFDVVQADGSTLILVYKTNFGQISIKFLNSALSPQSGWTDSVITSNISSIIRLFPLSGGRWMSVNVGTETNLQARVISAQGATVSGNIDTGIAKTIGSESVTQISGHESGSDGVVYAQYTAADESKNYIRRALVPTGGGSGTSSLFLRSVGLATRGWIHEGVGFVGISHKSDLQATYFVTDDKGNLVSRHQPGSGGYGTFNNCVAGVWSVVPDKYEFAILNKTRLIATTDTLGLYQFAGSATPNGANIYSPLNIAVTSIDFQDNSNFSAGEISEYLIIVGGVVAMYDSLSVVEQGFFLFPEGVTLAVGPSTGAVADGTYLVVVCYEWTDAKGLVHRSAPSIPVSITIAGGGSKQIVVTTPTLRLTAKKSPRANVTLVAYRTQSGQAGPFYRTSSVVAPTQNDPTIDTVQIIDGLGDASLPGRDILYTSGGGLDNTAPLPAKYLSVWRGRIMLTGGETNVVQFSKPIEKGLSIPVEFAGENTIGFESEDGPPTGLEILDEKLLLFKYFCAYYTFGDGPNPLGLGGSFSPFERVANMDVGCDDQQSTCSMPGGVIFRSARGYCSINSGLQVSYIGAQVEGLASQAVSSATLYSNENEVRITNSNGYALVYNYYYGRWSIFSNFEAVDGILWNGNYLHLKADGRVCMETPSIWRDDGSNYSQGFYTGWQSLSSIANFQRIYLAQLNGEYRSPVRVIMQIGYDTKGSWYSAGEINLDGTDDFHALQFYPDLQKCDSIRFSLTLLVDGLDGSAQGLKLNGLTLLFGIKASTSKLSATQRVAVSKT